MPAPLKLMVVFGTRPEAVKLAPVVIEAAKRPNVKVQVVVTAQHREMLDDVLRAFSLTPDVDLNLMTPGQSLYQITSRVITGMEPVLRELAPDVVMVQGDTTTTFATALAAFYARVQVAHVEAGLRTGDLAHPFPEEANRKMASVVTDYHFAPTDGSRDNLLREGYPAERIWVTGNTVIDALLEMAARVRNTPCPVEAARPLLDSGRRMVLVTGHRRESFGEPFERICQSLRNLALKHPNDVFIYPVHLNPNVQKPVNAILAGLPNFLLIPPLPYPEFVWFLQRSHLIVTDSGGVQEEAPALGKPVLVTRRKTERPEAVDAGVVKLVGDDAELIFREADELLSSNAAYAAMARGISPYGDGLASGRILDVLINSRREG